MILLPTYRTLFKSVLLFLVAGMLYTDALTYLHYTITANHNTIELCDPSDSSSEEEQENNKGESEKDKKVRTDAGDLNINNTKRLLRALLRVDSKSLNSQDIPTPPPEA